ncbi:hypothetical protein [Paenibacillus endoradicis]|uniref:hypothetical protein n=1 Tax=Paenibacillus endoradicis TaxID=2972487 RepID=UPI002159957E|nr:hypothetical protein [Paenibacillus endoradicis]MCR8659560.1 hypothetical protein [Paenibacillus endoradicis]
MKRFLSVLLSLVLLTPLISSGVRAESNTLLQTEVIVSVIDSDKDERTITLTFPKEAENIVKDSFTFSGSVTIKSTTINQDKRTITVVLKGKEKIINPTSVKGYLNSKGEWFPSNPGNAMCRYSDGIDWQIATVKTSDFSQDQKRFSNTSGSIPSNVPYNKLTNIATFVNITLKTTGVYWVDSKGNSIPSNQVETSSIDLPKGAVKSTMGSPIYPNGYNSKAPKVGVQYIPEAKPLNSLPTIATSNPAFLTGHAACYMYASPMSYYVTAKTLPGKAYDYNGTISYQYTKPTNAYIVGTLTADPTSTKFEDKDVTVKLTLDGEVLNLSEPGAIDYYMIYIRTEDSTINPPGIRVEGNSKLKVSASIDFTIPKSKLTNKTEFTEIYVGRVFAYYKPSSYYTGTLDSGQLKASSLVFKESIPAPTPPPMRSIPKAIIGSDSEVLLGDDVYVNGYDSYDTDGTIETYRWTMSGAKNPITKNEGDGWIWYDTLGAKTINLCVVDNDSLQDCTKHSLVVTEPIVKADIRQTGTLKENRKVTFTANGTTSSRYPIVDSKTTWKIESAYDDIPQSQIKTNSPLKGSKIIDVLFKKPGEYKVTVYMENTLGYTDEISRIYTILPDEVPYTTFTFQEKIYRDPVKGNLATFELTDRSYSTDGDQIVSRNWYVIFDANNDGIFNEAKVLFQSGNETTVTYNSTHVGKYRFLLEVQEEFGQPTIDAFVTASDRRKSNTWE